MRNFKDMVTVITGAASGIGRGIAERAVEKGMKVVLADVEKKPLQETEDELKAKGGDVISVLTDVSKREDVEFLSQKTLDVYGKIHLLCNNAGVAVGGLIWEASQLDWEWILGVNLWGVINGVGTFVPIMLQQDTECHIVNTASIEGLWSRHRNGPYQVTKHGVVALSEVLKHELTFMKTKIGVSVLCPGPVNTRIVNSGRNRPKAFENPQENAPEITPEMAQRFQQARKAFESGMSPLEVADHVFNAVHEGRFYIITHPDLKKQVQMRHDNIINDGIPNPGYTIPNKTNE